MNLGDGKHGRGKIFVKTSVQKNYVVEKPFIALFIL